MIGIVITAEITITVSYGLLGGYENHVYFGKRYYEGFSVQATKEIVALSDKDSAILTAVFLKRKLTLTIDSINQLSVTKVYCGDEGEPSSVYGALSWSYDGASNVLTVIGEHDGPIQFIIDWKSSVKL